jgi:hypothetical protein
MTIRLLAVFSTTTEAPGRLDLSHRRPLHMPNRSDNLRQIAREEGRLTAFHEAGHAAVLWFFWIPAIKSIELPLESELLAADCTEDGDCQHTGQLRTHLGLLNLRMYLGEFDINKARQYYKFDMLLSMGGPTSEAMFGSDSVDTDVALDYG